METFAYPEPIRVLVVDDDAEFRQDVMRYLFNRGLVARGADGGAEMDRMLQRETYDVVVLDVMMPGEDGLSICKRLTKNRGPAVVMVSVMGEEADRIMGLEQGADDYLAKPCNPRELVARLRAVLRRRLRDETERQTAPSGYFFAGAHLDVTSRRLRSGSGTEIYLTGGELSLLMAFVTNPNRILSREALLEIARGADADIFDRTIDTRISRLRRKIHDCVGRTLIVTRRGEGYVFKATPIPA